MTRSNLAIIGRLELLRAKYDRVFIPQAIRDELARQTGADLLLIDDQDGRQIAREEKLPFTGLLGVLAEERMGGRLPSLKAEIDRLRSECRFFISPELERSVLDRVGE